VKGKKREEEEEEEEEEENTYQLVDIFFSASPRPSRHLIYV